MQIGLLLSFAAKESNQRKLVSMLGAHAVLIHCLWLSLMAMRQPVAWFPCSGVNVSCGWALR